MVKRAFFFLQCQAVTNHLNPSQKIHLLDCSQIQLWLVFNLDWSVVRRIYKGLYSLCTSYSLDVWVWMKTSDVIFSGAEIYLSPFMSCKLDKTRRPNLMAAVLVQEGFCFAFIELVSYPSLCLKQAQRLPISTPILNLDTSSPVH